MKSHIYLLYFLWVILSQCSSNTQSKESINFSKPFRLDAKPVVSKKNQTNPKLDSSLVLKISGHEVWILSPTHIPTRGNIIVLPGWSYSKEDWCKNSNLCQKALAKGYRLIMPEMGKSVYSSQFYPETIADWKKYPHKSWLVQEMIPTLQKEYNILLENQSNFLLGLSTGGRGVALLALALPKLFKAGVALSGDFDQTKTPGDRLMIGYYGAYHIFKSRWEGEDNPVFQAHRFQTPLYLGHGKQDKIVPAEQTKTFYEALRKANPNLRLHLHLIDAAHNYFYWNSELDNVFGFFEKD
jgi:pimeloyl-ACP methyl ester carboxylesterase